MTYNPTGHNLLKAIGHGLVEYQPLRPLLEKRRLVICPSEIAAKLSGQQPLGDFPPTAVSAVIGSFMAGHVITVSRKKRSRERKENIELEQLEGLDEIWALCYRSPRPGWRIVGRFVDHDVMAVFRIYDKRDIGDDYQVVATEVINEWIDCLGQQQPHRGTTIADYISEPYYDMDKTP